MSWSTTLKTSVNTLTSLTSMLLLSLFCTENGKKRGEDSLQAKKDAKHNVYSAKSVNRVHKFTRFFKVESSVKRGVRGVARAIFHYFIHTPCEYIELLLTNMSDAPFFLRVGIRESQPHFGASELSVNFV